MNDPTNWLRGLADPEPTYAAMRAVRDRADRSHERYKILAPRYGTLPLGCSWIDPFIESQALYAFLMALNRGSAPAEAERVAMDEARLCVKNHNRNPGCVTVNGPHEAHRWEGTADAAVQWATILVSQAAR